MPKSKRDLIPQARSSFVSGRSVQQIAKSLGVSASTIHRWKTADEKRGQPWEKRRAEHQERDPHVVLARLKDQFWACLECDPVDADRLSKLHKMIEIERERIEDPGRKLEGTRDFLRWCWGEGGATAEQRALLEPLGESYTDYVKRKATD